MKISLRIITNNDIRVKALLAHNYSNYLNNLFTCESIEKVPSSKYVVQSYNLV